MEATEVRKLAELEEQHWWYRDRRHMLRTMVRQSLGPDKITGVALDIGAAGGGNTRVLRDLGLFAVAVEYGADGAAIGHQRGLPVVRADACHLAFTDAVADIVVAFDVIEHLKDDLAAIVEIGRVLRPGGHLLLAVPADMSLWSAHDTAVGHIRRYGREDLTEIISAAGLLINSVRSWNVLLRPVVSFCRRSASESDLKRLHPAVNLGLRGVIALERLPILHGCPGVSLVVRGQRPPSNHDASTNE